MHLKNVTLELSSKPFTDESEERMVSVCRTMFSQWNPLTEKDHILKLKLGYYPYLMHILKTLNCSICFFCYFFVRQKSR